MPSPPVAVLYSDPNCPFCYALEERLAAHDLLDRTEWRGVQHAPHLPVPMAPADPILAAELTGERRSLRTLAPELPLAQPPGKPNTQAAIEHGAAALRIDARRGRAFVGSLYTAFWRDGSDLSDADALTTLARDAGLAPIVVTPEDRDRVSDWHDAWRALGLGGVPCLIRHDGQLLYGLSPTKQLLAFLDVPLPRSAEHGT